MHIQGIQRGGGLAIQDHGEEGDMAGLPRRQPRGQRLRRGDRGARARHVRLHRRRPSLGDMGEREIGIGGDGPVEGIQRAGIHRQQQFGSRTVCFQRGRGRGGHRQAITIGHHRRLFPVRRSDRACLGCAKSTRQAGRLGHCRMQPIPACATLIWLVNVMIVAMGGWQSSTVRAVLAVAAGQE